MSAMFTVIIPTYNHAEFLRRAIRSVVEQTYADWDCIIVDNHSTDHTEKVVSEFQDSRLKLLKIHNDGVIAASRNMGIDNAGGKWLAFLDSDDIWYPAKLAVIAAEITSGNPADVFCTDELVVDQDGVVKGKLQYGPFCEDFYRAMLRGGNRLSTSATVIRREFLENTALRFREDRQFVTVEDYDLWMRLARAGAEFSFIPSVQGEYVIHGGNNSGNLKRHHNNLLALLHDHVFNLQDFSQDKPALWRVIVARVQLVEGRAAVANRNLWQGGMMILKAFARSPTGVALYAKERFARMQGIRNRRTVSAGPGGAGEA